METLLYYLIVINLLTFCLCFIDKVKAKNNRFRINEKVFFMSSILGGFLGLVLGMRLFHHKTTKKSFKLVISISFVVWMMLMCSYFVLDYLSLIPQKAYTADDFNIQTLKSDLDKNNNGIDDYADILLGAKMEAARNPKYKSTYYDGGYAPLSEGVCTDVVIRALLNAGYSLKDLIDEDIKYHTNLYPRVQNRPDPNIDFRRVKNLKVYFDRYLLQVTMDINKIEQWQPGDIVIFGKDYTHIGIISDKRNKEGIPYLIHNAGQPRKEEDVLLRWKNNKDITGHYRFQFVNREDD